MTVNSIKELKAIIALCRKEGVQSITIDGISLQLGIKSATRRPKQSLTNAPEADIRVPMFNGYQAPSRVETQDAPDVIDTEELSEDQLLYYSARPEAPGEQ